MKIVTCIFKNEAGVRSSGNYDYLTDIENLEKGELVFVEKSGWGEDIAEVVSYRKNPLSDIEYKQVVERVELVNEKVYLRGIPAPKIFDEKLKNYEKKPSLFKRLFGK